MRAFRNNISTDNHEQHPSSRLRMERRDPLGRARGLLPVESSPRTPPAADRRLRGGAAAAHDVPVAVRVVSHVNSLVKSALRYWVAAPLAAALLVAACGGVSAENYQKIQNGMTREEVHKLLGKPDDVSGAGIGELSFATEKWKGSQQTIHVTFVNDHVKTKSIGSSKDGGEEPKSN
jgi:hypothetical protein